MSRHPWRRPRRPGRALDLLGVGTEDTVLVLAAAGGVGSLAVQIARASGTRVIGTASEANHDFLRELGAEPVGYGDGLVERVRALAPDGVDAVADFVGGVREQTLAVLALGPGATGRRRAGPVGGPHRAGPAAGAGGRGGAAGRDAAAFRLSRGGHTRGKIVIRVSG